MIEPGGYKSLREKVVTDWKYVEVLDENEVNVFPDRLGVNMDSRVELVSDEEENPVSIQVTISSSDPDITQGARIKYFKLYDEMTGGTLLLTQEDLDGFTVVGKNSAIFTISINIPGDEG